MRDRPGSARGTPFAPGHGGLRTMASGRPPTTHAAREESPMSVRVTRRDFLKGTAAVGAGLAAGVGFPAVIRAQGGKEAIKVGVLHSLSGTMAISEAPIKEIVLMARRRGDALIERARRAGVMGYLLKPLRAEELPPVLDLAIARFAEIRDLRQRLEARKLIERAKGLLMTRQGLSEEEAFRILRRTAMNRRRSMAEVAQAVILAESMGREALAR
ncbi:MAG: hypothetical protein DME17_11290 [Candidatus Rokuibacteriota bacterium]|nr:MAG: hypothetical protein DME17_11290 [Candidatus Rokubacteria bacterium]